MVLLHNLSSCFAQRAGAPQRTPRVYAVPLLTRVALSGSTPPRGSVSSPQTPAEMTSLSTRCYITILHLHARIQEHARCFSASFLTGYSCISICVAACLPERFCVSQTSIITEGFRSLAEGEPVEFYVESGDDGRTKAVQVTGPAGAPPQVQLLFRELWSPGTRNGRCWQLCCICCVV